MASHNEKKEYILAQERKFSAQLGRAIMQKPQLSSWMVLIPFIFIFYFQDLSKYKNARKEFSENYMLSREKALREVESAGMENREIDTLNIAKQAEIPQKAQEKYGEFLGVVADHYSSLLSADGESYEELLRSVYGKKAKYLNYIEKLGSAEKALNRALQPDLEKAVEKVSDLVGQIETNSETIRRAGAQEFFA